jgi:predicted RNA binding protein YcfA (HicA-like mRNA interferase family)
MKLPQISGKDLIKIFIKLGFIIVRQRGSHIQIEKIIGSDIIKLTVPIHQQLKKGTLSHIIKASKINEKELEKYF